MHKSYRFITALLAASFSLGLLLFVAVGTAFAHASVIDSNPKASSTIMKVPATVQVTTAENMTTNPSETNLFVYAPDGKLISLGDAKVDINNPTHMSVGIKTAAGNGVYVVRWITKSAQDGDPDAGAFYFTVNANGTNAATTGTASTASTGTASTNASSPVLPVVIASIIALLVGLGAGFGVGRMRPASAAQATSNAETTQESQEKTPAP